MSDERNGPYQGPVYLIVPSIDESDSADIPVPGPNFDCIDIYLMLEKDAELDFEEFTFRSLSTMTNVRHTYIFWHHCFASKTSS